MSPHSRGMVGRILISSVAVLWPVGAFAADWNETHVFNPDWPAHAKFHNGQTIALGIETAALSLWQLWGPPTGTRPALRWGTLFAGLYYATQVPAVLFPGAAFTDPDLDDSLPLIAGIRLNQVLLSLFGAMPVLALGYALAARGLTSDSTTPAG